MTITTTSSRPTSRNAALMVARVIAGIFGSVQLAGALYFVFIAPEEAVWVGLWVDVPIVALLLTGVLLKLSMSMAPGLGHSLRINLGLVAVIIGMVITLIKIPVYDEPEGVTFVVLDAALLALLLLARRGENRVS